MIAIPITGNNSCNAAKLIMAHSGCHILGIYEFSSKCYKMMKEKRSYNPSNLKVCAVIPVVNKHSSKRRKSDDLRQSIRSSVFKRKLSETDETSDFIFRSSKIPRCVSMSDKPRPSDAFLRIFRKSSDEDFDDLRKSRRPSLRDSRYFKPRLSDAFLLRMPGDSPSDADDESTLDFNKSRRFHSKDPLRTATDSLDLTEYASDISTEDEELMRIAETTKNKPFTPSFFGVSGHWKIENGHFYILSDHSVESTGRFPVNRKIIKRDPTAKIIHYSSDEDVLYKDDCRCHFCKLLIRYHRNPLCFSRKFISEDGHGFFTRI